MITLKRTPAGWVTPDQRFEIRRHGVASFQVTDRGVEPEATETWCTLGAAKRWIADHGGKDSGPSRRQREILEALAQPEHYAWHHQSDYQSAFVVGDPLTFEPVVCSPALLEALLRAKLVKCSVVHRDIHYEITDAGRKAIGVAPEGEDEPLPEPTPNAPPDGP